MSTATPSQTAKTSARSGARGGLWLDVLALTLILALNWICYVRVINGYFLADDFLHVTYLKHVFEGDWMSLLKNFWGNWMQAEGTTFYRPLISLTLAFDYFCFGPNAAGFHLSNFFFQTAASLLLYLVITDIGSLFMAGGSKNMDGGSAHESYQPRLGALAAATLFSVSPLHCEVVAWIIARVDSVACMFYLASMALMLRSLRLSQKASRAALFGSLFAFLLSLCSKEMAITLPPTLALLFWLSPSGEAAGGARQRFFWAFKKSLPFWVVLVVYLILRTLALGTISGGYQGSIGEGLSGSLAKRWLFDGSFMRVLFPLNLDVFGGGHGLYKTLRVLYIVAAANFVAALLTAQKKGPLIKSLAFGFGWLILTLLPTYQVWNLTETLQGSRFIYFGTMPLTYMLSLLIMPPVIARARSMARLFLPLRLVLLAFFIGVFATITSKNNQPWHHAMTELKTFQTALCHLAEKRPDKNIVLLNIPENYRGAHMLYNGATMSVMLAPPLAPKDIVDQIYTFEPATFGDADLIDISRLRRLASPANVSNVFYLWDRDKFTLEPVSINGLRSGLGTDTDKEVLFKDDPAVPGSGLVLTQGAIALSAPIDLPAVQIDAIAVKLTPDSWQKLNALKDDAAVKNAVLYLSYKGGFMALPILQDAASAEVVFQLSEHKNWLKQGLVHELSLKTVGCPIPIEVSSIEALSLKNQLPVVEADGRDLVEGPDGICRVKGPRPTFSYDLTNIPGAVSAVCEISQPNSWFEHYSSTLRDKQVSKHALYITPFNKIKGSGILLSYAGIKDHGFYQIKVAAVDKDGKVLGYFSDPLNFQI